MAVPHTQVESRLPLQANNKATNPGCMINVCLRTHAEVYGKSKTQTQPEVKDRSVMQQTGTWGLSITAIQQTTRGV